MAKRANLSECYELEFKYSDHSDYIKEIRPLFYYLWLNNYYN